MKNAVEIYNDEPRCGTYLIAEGFKRRHNKILELVRKHEKQFLEAEASARLGVKPKLLERKIKTAGRPVIEYLLNKEQTTFLGMLFRATSDPDDPVLKFKARLAKDFIKQEKLIIALMSERRSPEWIERRATGKVVRKKETDTIKDFVEYCKHQGSKNADKYYVALTKCVNNNMFSINGKFKNVRDVMTATQLMDVKFADKVVSKALIEGMAQGKPYKDIYQLVKQRVITLAEIYGQSEIVSKDMMIAE